MCATGVASRRRGRFMKWFLLATGMPRRRCRRLLDRAENAETEVAAISKLDWSVHRSIEYQADRESRIHWRWLRGVSANADRVPQRSCLIIPRQSLYRCRRHSARRQLGKDLTLQRVRTPRLLVAWQHQRCEALPDASASFGTQELVYALAKRERKATQLGRVSLAREGEAHLANASLGPRSLEGTNSALSGGAQAHRRIDQDVLQVAVAIQVQRKEVGMSVALERRSISALSGQLGTVRTPARRRPGNE